MKWSRIPPCCNGPFSTPEGSLTQHLGVQSSARERPVSGTGQVPEESMINNGTLTVPSVDSWLSFLCPLQASILDLHSGALSMGKQFVNIYRCISSLCHSFCSLRAVMKVFVLCVAVASNHVVSIPGPDQGPFCVSPGRPGFPCRWNPPTWLNGEIINKYNCVDQQKRAFFFTFFTSVVAFFCLMVVSRPFVCFPPSQQNLVLTEPPSSVSPFAHVSHRLCLCRYFGDQIREVFTQEDFQLYRWFRTSPTCDAVIIPESWFEPLCLFGHGVWRVSSVRDVRGRIQAAIADTFALDPALMYLTKPTFFSRINSTAAQTQHDEYWHPHVDKVRLEGRAVAASLQRGLNISLHQFAACRPVADVTWSAQTAVSRLFRLKFLT